MRLSVQSLGTPRAARITPRRLPKSARMSGDSARDGNLYSSTHEMRSSTEAYLSPAFFFAQVLVGSPWMSMKPFALSRQKESPSS